jgi:hypothetical protein
MKEPLVMTMTYWILERENMRIRKEVGGRWPFSTDPTMANSRYTNVRREDDKVTKWLAENWRRPDPELTKWMCLARMVNYIPTLEHIPRDAPWNTEAITDVIDELVCTGGKVWSSAYMITTCGKKMNKVDYVVDHVCSRVPEVVECGTLAAAYKKLRTVDGLGSFLAGQILADLKNTKGVGLYDAPDWHSFSVPGPGSLRGLSMFFDRPVTAASYQAWITHAWDLVRPGLPSNLQDLSMQDFQNCFCEFSKYMRGWSRNVYKG